MFGFFFKCGARCDCVVDSALDAIDPSHIQNYYKNKSIRAKCIEVYDGDTCTVIHYIGTTAVKAKVRLYGIDTPEIKQPKDMPKTLRNKNKLAANVAKARVETLILNKHLNLITQGSGEDKYGRVLARIELESGFLCMASVIDLTTVLLEEKLGAPYDGGTKVISCV